MTSPTPDQKQAVHRLLDANLDRAREGLRVVEDWCRFGLDRADLVAKAEPDGHTLLLMSNGTAVSAGLMKQLPYDPVRDLAPVTLLASSPYVIAVHPKVPVNTLAELVTHARANRGRLNYSSAGIGTSRLSVPITCVMTSSVCVFE